MQAQSRTGRPEAFKQKKIYLIDIVIFSFHSFQKSWRLLKNFVVIENIINLLISQEWSNFCLECPT